MTTKLVNHEQLTTNPNPLCIFAPSFAKSFGGHALTVISTVKNLLNKKDKLKNRYDVRTGNSQAQDFWDHQSPGCGQDYAHGEVAALWRGDTEGRGGEVIEDKRPRAQRLDGD